MKLCRRPLGALIALIALIALRPSDAGACGGCFHEPSQTESTVVTGHRMAFAVSPARTILWDQIEYSGAPSSFAWVLPVKSGAEIELSTDAWFEALDAATTVQVVSPPADCAGPTSGGGCSLGCSASENALYDRGAGNRPDVTVVHQGTVGPYETVTLHANVPGALPDWLTSHGFAIDAGVQPVIDAYAAEGFDFIALRLLPGQGVQQMKPVRVVTPGGSPTLPLRMVAAGTGAKVGITLFVVGEGRWEAQNFPNGQVSAGDVVWDFATQKSSYATLRAALLASGGGRTWSTSYAKAGALLRGVSDGQGNPTPYTVAGFSAQTIAEAYVRQGLENGESTDASCLGALGQLADATSVVSGACLGEAGGGGGAGGAGTGGMGAGGGAGTGGVGAGGGAPGCVVGADEIDARTLACGPLDDVAAALAGMHPRDVWITRLEADLPRAALASDLALKAGAQAEVDNWISVTKSVNSPCAAAAAASIGPSARWVDIRRENQLALAASVLLAVAAALGRRRRRRPAYVPATAR